VEVEEEFGEAVTSEGTRPSMDTFVELDSGKGSARSAATDPNKTVTVARKSLE